MSRSAFNAGAGLAGALMLQHLPLRHSLRPPDLDHQAKLLIQQRIAEVKVAFTCGGRGRLADFRFVATNHSGS